MKTPILLVILTVCSLSFAWPDGNRPIVHPESGDPYMAGQLIVTLAPSLRGAVALGREEGLARFGVPALDEICRRWQVNDITALWRHPVVPPEAIRLNSDMVYIIQFPEDQDIFPVKAELRARPEVLDVCRNAWLRLPEQPESAVRAELPDDTLYGRQWHLPIIGAPIGWEFAKGDTSVRIAVLDDGTEWHHPDIEPNLWVNHPEDINNNGRFDPYPWPDGDLDGIDQDGNGFIDDVIGWNFVGGTPNPEPARLSDDHGTHCWGTANAVTNNLLGVAAPAWNVRSFGFRCGGGGGIQLQAAIYAINYAINEGVWVISMSFGGYSQYQPLRDACQLAWDMGSVLVAGAGNDGRNSVFYPAGYPSVLAIAASAQNDRRASWSNFGTWIAITAPGEGIFSTLTNHGYGTMSGTSMSTPLVAGVLAWIKSAFPALTNAQAVNLMFAACDSMPDDYYRDGLLGAGRVSMANIVLPLFHSNLTMTDWRWNDAGGNNNGRPDPGETASLVVTYANSDGWQPAAGVTATLSSPVREIQILKGTARFPDIPPGESRHCSADSFVVRIPASVPPQMIKFVLTVNSDPSPAYPDTQFVVQSGDPRMLLVDDDLGKDYERWYTAACDSNGILYDIWNVQARGQAPGFDDLRGYPVVVWWTGDDSVTTLQPADRTALGQYLDAGNRLIVSGKNIARQLAGEPFLRDYLRSEFVTGDAGTMFLVGVSDCPLTRGDTVVAGGGGGANNGQSLDGVRAVNGGQGSAWYRDGDPDVYGIVRHKATDGHSMVFLALPFEAINHQVTRYLQKWTLLRRTLEWMGEAVPGVEEAESGELPLLPDKRPYALRVTPSPVTGLAWVEFMAPVSGRVELRAYSLAGRLVYSKGAEVTVGERSRVEFDATGLAAGTYLLQLHTPTGAYAQRATVVR